MNLNSIINKEYIKEIKTKTGIDLSNEINYINFNLNNIKYEIDISYIVQKYINHLSKYVKCDLNQFYTYKYNDKLQLYYDAGYMTSLNDQIYHIQTSELGEFLIASKYLVDDEYVWELYIKDRFSNNLFEVKFKKDNLMYKYFDSIVEYCDLSGNKTL